MSRVPKNVERWETRRAAVLWRGPTKPKCCGLLVVKRSGETFDLSSFFVQRDDNCPYLLPSAGGQAGRTRRLFGMPSQCKQLNAALSFPELLRVTSFWWSRDRFRVRRSWHDVIRLPILWYITTCKCQSINARKINLSRLIVFFFLLFLLLIQFFLSIFSEWLSCAGYKWPSVCAVQAIREFTRSRINHPATGELHLFTFIEFESRFSVLFPGVVAKWLLTCFWTIERFFLRRLRRKRWKRMKKSTRKQRLRWRAELNNTTLRYGSSFLRKCYRDETALAPLSALCLACSLFRASAFSHFCSLSLDAIMSVDYESIQFSATARLWKSTGLECPDRGAAGTSVPNRQRRGVHANAHRCRV